MRHLDPASWTTLSPLFDQALDLEAGDRRRFLDALCKTDPGTGEALTRLLAAHDRLQESTFLEQPALGETEPDLAGSTVGAYTLDDVLGAGGMGVVWKAHRSDGRYEGAVAVKLLRLAVLERHTGSSFTLEGTLLARLSHPNIARLLDAGVTAAGQPYLVLDFVNGTRIDTFAETRRLDLPARLALLLQVADAVAHAHAHLVLHRDLKPSNVLVEVEGRVKLLDFGIGSWLSQEGVQALPGGSPGFTPEFAAPEQLVGGEITTATDVYTLGGLAHLLLAGRRPQQPVPDGRAARMPRDLALIVAKAMRPEPVERYTSVGAFGDDLRRFLAHEPLTVRANTVSYRTGRFIRRNRLAVALAAAAAVVAIAGAASTWVQSQRAEAERDFALRQLSRAEAMNDMNAFLLSDAAPLGEAFTAGALLARAEDILNRHPAEPADETTVESMISIGRQFWSQDEDDNARRVLTRAYDLSLALGVESISTRAKAACALASALARGDDLPRARTLVQEGLDRVPADRPFVLDRVFCEQCASEVAREGGDAVSDIAHAKRAEELLHASRLGSELAKLSAATHLAEGYRAAGRNAEASTAFESAFVRLTAMGRDRTEMAGTLLNNWGLSRYLLGQPREAERLFRRAVEIASADAVGTSVSPMLLNNLARPVLELGRADEALTIANQAAAEATRLGHSVVVVQGMLLRATAYRETGDLARAGALLDEFERTQRARLPTGHAAFSALASEQALLAEAGRDFGAARKAADRAVTIAEASSQGRELLARGLLRRASLALAEDRAADALGDAERGLALELERAEPGVSSSILGRAYLTLGQAMQAAGRTDDARTTLTQALQHLDASLGVEHRVTGHARDLLARLAPPTSP